MAVAAYASVLSLLRVIDNIQLPSRLRLFPDSVQIDALREKLCFLQEFLQLHSSAIGEDIELVVRRVPEVASDAESSIDKYVVDQLYKELYPQSDVLCGSLESFHVEIHRVIQEIESINVALKTLRTTTQHVQVKPRVQLDKFTGDKPLKNKMVGFDDQLKQVLEKLIGNQPHLVIVPIVGMGGIGKTTLARSLFDHPYNLEHFDVRIWLTISQDFSVEKILQGLLKDGVISDKEDGEGDECELKGDESEPKFDQSEPKGDESEPKFDQSEPKGDESGPNGDHTEPKGDESEPKVDQSEPKGDESGPKGDHTEPKVDESEPKGDESEPDLITLLHKKLFGKRYLIVLDDVWNLDAWYDLKRGFPNNKGSRVMATTRLSGIVNSLDSPTDSYSMKFLDDDKSWDLFREKAFEKGGRSRELEEIGRKISKRCKGLPILLASIGGLLANSNMTVEHWKTVAEDINSFDDSANDEYCSRILSLSYHELPIHLKPCFLYTRHFKEDSDIKVSELIKNWVSHGFVKPMAGKSLEEAAKIYVEDLIGRNMFLIRKRGKNGSIKICGIHDLLRDLTIKESKKEHSLELPKVLSVHDDTADALVICNQQEIKMTTFYSEILGSVSNGKKVLMTSSCKSTFPTFARSRFVTAAEIVSQNVLLPTTCRSIGINAGVISIFRTLRLIWNLEILDIQRFGVVLPKEVWVMPQLRHVDVLIFTLPEPASTTNEVTVLENLQTLYIVKQFKCTEDIVRRIPNLRRLGLRYSFYLTGEQKDWSSFDLQNLARLQKLESLYIDCWKTCMDFNFIAFPRSLKELTLKGCKIDWGDLAIIISLPNLEVLKLMRQSVLGKEWYPIDGEFPRLRFLKLVGLELARWSVETQFPALETLFLDGMNFLEVIPEEIGDLPSLNSIYLRRCSYNIIASVKEAVEEQRVSYGNERLACYVEGKKVRVA